MERKVISPIDIILILIVVILGVAGLAYYRNHKMPGNMVSIIVDGKEVLKRDINSKDKVMVQVLDGVATEIRESDGLSRSDGTVGASDNSDDSDDSVGVSETIVDNTGAYDSSSDNSGDNRNIIVIEKGKVSVIDANCPDKICVEHKEIDSVGETIICLPHKLIVEIVGD